MASALLWLAQACVNAQSKAPDVTPAASPAVAATAPSHATSEPPASPAEQNLPPPLLALGDRVLLTNLEARGFDIGTVGFGTVAFDTVALGAARTSLDRSNRGLLASPAYRSLVAVLERDLAEFDAADARLGVGMRHAHRAFDPSWLSSEMFRFELAGIVNRIDRRVFAPDTCGELRLLYRLSYRADVRGQTIDSRVPMTVNVVRWLPGGDCAGEAERFAVDPAAASLEQRLTEPGGALHDLLSRTRLKSIEVNLQSARWPSTVRPNMAGHAEYLLRVFRPDGEELRPSALENTPDVVKLQRDGALRARLLAWLRTPDVLRAVDQGTVLLPDEFLAERAISVAPHGLARAANRPLSASFASDLQGATFEGYRTFASGAGLLRRLDGLSCQGCHQTRSVAGFHFLGDDDASRRADVIAVAHSQHFGDELVRRTSYLDALLSGQSPDESRPPAERMARGVYGAHCGLHSDGEFAAWDCEPGLSCQRVNDEQVGLCLPSEPSAGDACEVGTMIEKADARRDFVRLDRPTTCGTGVCERNAVGFPGGMCSGSCAALPASATCGGIALLSEFNACLARQIPFEQCILDNSRPGALRKCSSAEPCREDYICARLPSGDGGCIPPYFLFQMRVDGHVFR